MAAPDESGGCGSPEVSDSLGIGEARWKGDAMPSLAPNADDTYEFEIPGYDMRKLIHARDPLCAANAFFIQIRGVVAPILGVRMCPECPHCNESSIPCQDALGSNAELMGGVAPPVILISPQIGKLKNVMLFDDVMLNIVGFCEVWNTNLRILWMHAVLVLFEGRNARNELLAFKTLIIVNILINIEQTCVTHRLNINSAIRGSVGSFLDLLAIPRSDFTRCLFRDEFLSGITERIEIYVQHFLRMRLQRVFVASPRSPFREISGLFGRLLGDCSIASCI